MADSTDGQTAAAVAFLLAQLGEHAAAKFAERIESLELTPAHAGVLRLVSVRPGCSQQVLAGALGALPSKVVALVDELQRRGLVERRRNPADRRLHALHLTDEGEEMLRRVRSAAETHGAELTRALDPEQRGHLADLLGRIAADQGLQPGVHPGYQRLRG
ncbi:winged helix-turn-helix transcriptional regulator [Planomonospora sp. ID91781]|uniref:MarR family winged helix-turn-helix transcriptional regulator n=1 Tax=Planomonospora sp. ID91781 TaxID=2738135 RepID=UPI0018C36944|nr:MarR family winged helix-turn-helix transcriptional regulator [Planomonospora sp. ID91781]MBG0822617.1 winged helix-turn-helix transcriptional regulator [Planomonospora sp. ID91781]